MERGRHPGDSSRPAPVCEPSTLGSPYIPVDSWVYPAVLRLYSLGFVDMSISACGLDPRQPEPHAGGNRRPDRRCETFDAVTDEAQEIYEALITNCIYDITGPCLSIKGNTRVESVYSVARGISGTPLRDSYHLGSTIINDYGRPYQNGFNNYSGASGYASAGRFLLYVARRVSGRALGHRLLPGTGPGALHR